MGGYGRVKGVSVHGSNAYGMLVKSSSHIEVSDLILAGAKQFGLALEGTKNVTVDRALISDVKTRGLALLDNAVDKEGCVTIGALDNTKTGTAV